MGFSSSSAQPQEGSQRGAPAAKRQRVESSTLLEGSSPSPQPAASPAFANAGDASTPLSKHLTYIQKRKSGKLIVLGGPARLDDWIVQTENMARATGCYAELTMRFESFPDFDSKQRTPESWICEMRFTTAWRILHDTIAGSLWAYMRVIGYAKLPVEKKGTADSTPMPCDAFSFAKEAARRIDVAGTLTQPLEERLAMVDELHNADVRDYPSRAHLKNAKTWMKPLLESLARHGDEAVAEKLRNPAPQNQREVAAKAVVADPRLTPTLNIDRTTYYSDWSGLRPDGRHNGTWRIDAPVRVSAIPPNPAVQQNNKAPPAHWRPTGPAA